ncbi:MAG: DUF1800 family protein [Gammaproteobacteria bacterium]
MFNRSRVSLALAKGLFLWFVLSSHASWAVDTDSDGVEDSVDNCLLIDNPAQNDTDSDSYGNWCDADFNQNGIVNFQDLFLLNTVFFESEPFSTELAGHADMNSDGAVNFLDLALFRGSFLSPPGPAALSEPFDENAAARFLTQTTYGATSAEITALAASGDIEGWIDQQMAITPSSHETLTREYALNMCFHLPEQTNIDGNYSPSRQAAWWTIVLDGDDQLRQRVAFALSQIVVVGDRNVSLGETQYGLASYYDMLAGHAFGNYRDLLEDVTLHPVMGMFLSMVRNERPQPELNIRPDENYARELLQLFSIGVHQLNLDGTKVLDAQGQPIPTYNQQDIENFARVFTGWNFPGINWYQWFAYSDRTLPMEPWEEYHDTDPKTLLGAVLPSGQDAQTDLDAALDNVFNHPNVGPFVSYRLIQRLVTSNPTPGYVERVATKFNDNGAGVRGDLGAVVRAILLDPEARQGHVYLESEFGKLREPLLRVSHMRRAMGAFPIAAEGNPWSGAPCGQSAYSYYVSLFGSSAQMLGQQAQGSPSVFNFYRPDYSPPGYVRDNGLVAPEFQLFVASTAQTTGKVLAFEAQNNEIWGPGNQELDMTEAIALGDNPGELLDYYDTLLMSGQMSASMRNHLLNHMNDPRLPDDDTLSEVRARDVLTLIVMSPEYLIQR